jgi:hypothetical protein
MSSKFYAEQVSADRQERLAAAKAAPPMEPEFGPSKTMTLDRYEELLEFGATLGKSAIDIDKMLKAAGCVMNADRPGPLLFSKGGYSIYFDQYVRAQLTGEPLPMMIDEPPAEVPPPKDVDFDQAVTNAPSSVVTPGELRFDREAFEAWYLDQDEETQEALPVQVVEKVVYEMVVDWAAIANLFEAGFEIGGVTLVPLQILEGEELEKALNTSDGAVDGGAGASGDNAGI